MLKNAILSVAVVLVLASWAGATTLTYSVVVNTTVSPNTFDIYAHCPGTAGLAGLSFDVTATGNISLLSGTVTAVQGLATSDSGDLYLTGFGVWRNSGVLSPQLISGVHAFQDTAYGKVNDPFFDSLIIQNLGIAAPYQIYHGTFSGNSGQIALSSFDGGGTLMNRNNGPWVGPGNVLSVYYGPDALTIVAVPATVVPEPATLSLLALGGLGLIRRRRK